LYFISEYCVISKRKLKYSIFKCYCYIHKEKS
jgi:hypothetical protein